MISLKEWDRLIAGWEAHRDRAERDRQAATIFFDVIRRNDWESAMRLLSRGASANWSVNGMTPLQEAARYGAMQSANLLLAAGSALGAVDGMGRDALWHALLYRQDAMLDLLIARGADIDRRAPSQKPSRTRQPAEPYSPADRAQEATPLIQAAIDGNFHAARALVRANCAVNARDGQGQNALHHCLKKSDPTADDVAIARLLLENGGEPTAVDLSGRRPVDMVSDPAYAAALEAQSIAVEIAQVQEEAPEAPPPSSAPRNSSAPRRRRGMRL
jgi:hypothetical protein